MRVDHIDAWMATLPPELIYAAVGLVIGLESMGVPLPGELTLVTAALLGGRGIPSLSLGGPAASVGAIGGDSVGYAGARRGGRALLARRGSRSPRHFGPAHLARAE